MSYAEDLKQKLNDNSEPISAVIYARVSTDNDGQKDSCANQVALAEKFISSHSNIHTVGVFIDDGISGKNDFTRSQYNAMLQLISEGKVDLVITKALSRLNRDQSNSLKLSSMLVEQNTTVLTLEDNQVHDFEDMGSELMHSISFAIDAQYVKRHRNCVVNARSLVLKTVNHTDMNGIVIPKPSLLMKKKRISFAKYLRNMYIVTVHQLPYRKL